jgi:hypothetical protein
VFAKKIFAPVLLPPPPPPVLVIVMEPAPFVMEMPEPAVSVAFVSVLPVELPINN